MPPSPLRILADANIPDVQSAFGPLGEVRVMPGQAITRRDLAEVDVLVVRSVTRVDRALLDGTPVRFVGTATAGVDHVDQAALASLGVAFASAPGSNAASVVDHVLAALLAVAADRGETLAGRTLGIVGVGEVGGRLARRARALGLHVLACDPPRAHAGHRDHDYVGLGDVLDQADVVSLHTPLTTAGDSPWPTLGLVDRAALQSMRPDAWLVNAARGAVVTAQAAQMAAQTRPVVLDVWPGEPAPRPGAGGRRRARHAPHRGLRGRRQATRDGHDRRRAVRVGPPRRAARSGRRLRPARRRAPDPGLDPTPWLDALARQACDVRADDARFRAALAGTVGEARAAAFADLRRTYPTRREMDRYVVRGDVPEALRRAVEDGLGMTLERGP